MSQTHLRRVRLGLPGNAKNKATQVICNLAYSQCNNIFYAFQGYDDSYASQVVAFQVQPDSKDAKRDLVANDVRFVFGDPNGHGDNRTGPFPRATMAHPRELVASHKSPIFFVLNESGGIQIVDTTTGYARQVLNSADARLGKLLYDAHTGILVSYEQDRQDFEMYKWTPSSNATSSSSFASASFANVNFPIDLQQKTCWFSMEKENTITNHSFGFWNHQLVRFAGRDEKQKTKPTTASLEPLLIDQWVHPLDTFPPWWIVLLLPDEEKEEELTLVQNGWASLSIGIGPLSALTRHHYLSSAPSTKVLYVLDRSCGPTVYRMCDRRAECLSVFFESELFVKHGCPRPLANIIIDYVSPIGFQPGLSIGPMIAEAFGDTVDEQAIFFHIAAMDDENVMILAVHEYDSSQLWQMTFSPIITTSKGKPV